MTRMVAAQENNFLLPNGTFVVELILFVVVLLIFYRYIVPPLAKAMRERDDMARKQVEDDQEATRRFTEAEERFSAALAEARAAAGRIRDEARAEGNRVRDEMREHADGEVERIRRHGADEIAEQRDQAMRQLRGEIGGLSSDLADRVLGESGSGEGKRSTVDRFLADLDQADATDGRTSKQTAGGAN